MVSDIAIYAFSFGITGLFVYSLLRFGSVNHTWAQFTKEELAELKRLHAQAALTAEKAKPAGNPLYKKGMISHNGITVYPNGIYAKWCIGQSGKYRFVPFSSISAIYPAEMQNPFTTTDSAWTGLKSWKELQVETRDYMVYMIDSRAHDLQTLVPVLKQAMGAQWDTVYKEHTPIKGSIIEGPFLRHTFLRGEPQPESSGPAPQPSSAAVEFGAPAPAPATTAQMPLPEGPGAQLAVESPEDLREKGASYRKGAAMLLLISIAALAGAAVMWVWLGGLTAMVLVVLGVMTLVLTGLIMKFSSNPVPMRMHENGFVIPNLLGAEIFVPYGRINRVTETDNFIDGPMYTLYTADGQIVGLRKGNRAFMDVFEKVKGRFNDARYDIPVKSEVPRLMGGKADLYIYLASVPLGLALAYVTALQAFEEMSLSYHMFVIVYVWPPMAILSLLLLFRLTRKMPKIVGSKPGWKAPIAIVVAMMVLFFAGQAVMYNVEFPSTSSGGVASMEPVPTASVLSGSLYENQTLNVTGDVLVGSGESLELRNCTLRFGGTADKDSSVYVAPGGQLTLINCTLESATPGVMYSFEAHGTLWMIDCEVTDVWGDVQNVNYDGGLEIYSHATLVRVSVMGAATNGLFAMNSTVEIEDCVFENCADDALEIKGATVLVSNTTISNAGWAMVIDDNADVTVTRSEITGNEYGICAEDATLNVNNCTLTNNLNYAIEYSSGTDATLADNTYSGNEMDVSGSSGYELVVMCNVMVLIEGLVCAMMVIHGHKTISN